MLCHAMLINFFSFCKFTSIYRVPFYPRQFFSGEMDIVFLLFEEFAIYCLCSYCASNSYLHSAKAPNWPSWGYSHVGESSSKRNGECPVAVGQAAVTASVQK